MKETSLSSRLKIAVRKYNPDVSEDKEKVSFCFCGGFPHLERFRDKMFIKCSVCQLRGDIVDEFDYDGAVHSWNMKVKEVQDIFGK